jgi:hypothetical protein
MRDPGLVGTSHVVSYGKRFQVRDGGSATNVTSGSATNVTSGSATNVTSGSATNVTSGSAIRFNACTDRFR